MKVLHVLDSLNRGGAEIMALDLCRNAKTNGLDLIFAATGGGELESDFGRANVEFIRLQRKTPIDLKLVYQLRQIILARGIQIIHSHQPVEALHSYLATRHTKTKCVLTLHGYIGDLKNRLALNFLLPRMDANISVGRQLLERFRIEEKIKVCHKFHYIANGVDIKRLQFGGTGLRAEIGLTSKHILLGMVGNFHLVKDQMTICRALPELIERAPEVHFVFIGGPSGSAPQSYAECVSYCSRESIKDHVHFVGKRSDIPDVLSSLDAFVFSSLQEGQPIAVIEAMMMGLPIVVSDIGPLIEVTNNGASALVFRRGDPEDLVAKLTYLLNSSEHFAQLGARAKEWATRQFSIEKHIFELASLYERLVFRA